MSCHLEGCAQRKIHTVNASTHVTMSVISYIRFFDELAKNCRQDMFAAPLPGPSSFRLDGRRYQQIALT